MGRLSSRGWTSLLVLVTSGLSFAVACSSSSSAPVSCGGGAACEGSGSGSGTGSGTGRGSGSGSSGKGSSSGTGSTIGSGSGTEPPSDGGTPHDGGIPQDSGSGHDSGTGSGDSGGLGSPSMTILSWTVPAYASSAQSPASKANDGTQENAWRSNGYPSWLAYDLSSKPAASRQKVFVSWWSPGNYGYDSDQGTTPTPSYNLPGAYILEGNAAAGGGSAAPTTGWVQLKDPSGTAISVTGNELYSREHVAMLNGMNWIRLNASAGATTNANENTDISIAMDVYDASQGLDAWNFIGDSITAFFQIHPTATGVAPTGFADGNYQTLIHNGVPGLFAGNTAFRPAFNGNGCPGSTTSYWVTNLARYLALWPSPYVGIQLGANNAGTNPTAFYNDMVTIVDALLAANKSVYIATPSWQSVDAGHQDMSMLAAEVPILVTHYAGKPVYAGPDMYKFFSQSENQTYITTCIATGNCGLHPDPAGQAIMRNLWAEKAYDSRYAP